MVSTVPSAHFCSTSRMRAIFFLATALRTLSLSPVVKPLITTEMRMTCSW